MDKLENKKLSTCILGSEIWIHEHLNLSRYGYGYQGFIKYYWVVGKMVMLILLTKYFIIHNMYYNIINAMYVMSNE